jgi:hypothetical protein
VTQTFAFNQISTTLVSTSDEVLMNAARYQARVLKSRDISTSDVSAMDSVVKFSMIMAHVVDSKGFPFAVPDAFAHPETVGLAWDSYMLEDTALWNQLLSAIEAPEKSAKQIADKLPNAIAEMDVISAHNISPFKGKQTVKQQKQQRR